MIKRTGGAPTIRYFDLFLLIDNEKGAVTSSPPPPNWPPRNPTSS